MMKKSLAHRKMFRNGGAVNGGPAGIMASSPSLIDAVTRDAMDPQGGQTLSMADGGIVRMQKGGSARAKKKAWGPGHRLYHGSDSALSFPRANTMPDFAGGAMVPSASPAIMSDKNILRWDPTTARRSGTTPMSADKMISETLIETGQRIFPESFEVGQADIDVVRKGQPVSNIERGAFSTLGVLRDYGRDAADWLQAAGRKLGEEEIAGDPDAALKALDVGHYEAIQDMTRMYPEHEGFITNEAFAAVAKHNREKKMALDRGETPLRDMTPDELKGKVALALEAPQREVAMEAVSDTDVDTAGIPGAGEGSITEAEALLQEAPPEDIQDYPPDPSQDDTLGADDAPPATPSAEEVAKKVLKEAPDPNITGGADEHEALATPTDPADAAKQIADTFNKSDMTPKEAERGMEYYLDRFKSGMPKYEGMSESEKGMLIAEAGLKVMAGQSPDAITNIAEGLKGISKEFIADKKERRAYERQIGLSAAKYALQSMDRDQTRLEALAKERRAPQYFAVRETFTDPDTGRVWKAGSQYMMSMGDVQGGKYAKLAPYLTSEKLYDTWLDSKAKAAKLLGPMMIGSGKGAPTVAQLDKSLKDYQTIVDSARTSAKMKTFVDSSIIKNAKGNVTGFSPWASRKLDSLLNAANYKGAMDKLNAIGMDRDKGIESKEFLYQQQVISNMMLKEILGEGSKNVSNIDRTLAQEIVGMMSDWSALTTSPEVLNLKLQRIGGLIDEGFQSDLQRMKSSDFAWSNVYNRAKQPVSSRLGEMRGELRKDITRLGYTPGVQAARAAGSTAPLRVYDYFDRKTGKLKKRIPRV